MADNIAVTVGTGTTIDVAGDLVSGALHQRVKVSVGADGTAADWPVGSGNQSAVPRVTLATDSPGVTAVGQTTKAASLPVTIASDQDPAHDAADSGVGPKQTFKATTSLSGLTLVSDADRTNGFAGVDGVQIVRPHANLEDLLTPVPVGITDGSSTSIMASAGAGVKNYVTTCIIANTSSTAVTVNLRDGAAGTVKATFPVPASTSGVVCNFPVPLGFSAATAVCAHPSASASTITVTLLGFKSKI